jgi:hypothetical protein
MQARQEQILRYNALLRVWRNAVEDPALPLAGHHDVSQYRQTFSLNQEVSMHYFAYGANMDVETLKERNVKFKTVVIGKVRDVRLVFHVPGSDDTGRADLMDDRRSHVHGVIYDIPEESLAGLDVYEGVERGRYRRQQIVVQTERGELSCSIYRGAKFRAGLKPSAEYLARLIRGAQHHGLPQHYLTFLQSHGTTELHR